MINSITSIASVLFLSLFAANITTAQTVKLSTAKSQGFQVDKTTDTGEVYKIEGSEKEWPIYITASGSPYIASIGSKGEYPVWIGSKHPTYTDEKGNAIRVSKSGKAVIGYIKPNGHPHVKYVSFTVQ